MEEYLNIKDYDFFPVLFGVLDKRKKWLEEKLNISIGQKNNRLFIGGEEENIELALEVMKALKEEYEKNGNLDEQKIRYIVDTATEIQKPEIKRYMDEILLVTHSGKSLRAKTYGQARYIHSMIHNDIVFGIGPAGTGKTYLAMAMAVDAYRKKEIERIILTRPAVEAGESLGFLPGDLQEKIDPYLRPLYDALFDIMGPETFNRLKEKDLIEVAPLAYMRGRTLDNSFIILDEAQNTSNEQMKMFLTRMGYGSKTVVTGDITQIDLPRGQKSGLIIAKDILRKTKGIGVIELDRKDVVRHPLVQKIIDAYARVEKK